MTRKNNPKNANEQFTENLPQTENIDARNPTTDKKLSAIADVSEKTYRMGAKILQSDNEQLKQEVLSVRKVSMLDTKNSLKVPMCQIRHNEKL